MEPLASNPRRVLVTGATGFTGAYVTKRLVEAGHNVAVFARDREKAERLKTKVPLISISLGSFENPDSLAAALKNRDVLVNVASLGFGHADAVVSAAEAADLDRAVFFSTTSIFTTLPGESKTCRRQAESRIMASSLAWTIIRPTMIFGNPADRNIIRLINWIGHHHIVPVFGPGTFRLQPIFVDDLAVAVAGILEEEATTRKAYNLSGETVLTYNELVRTIADIMAKRVRLVHLPLSVSMLTVRLAGLVPGLPKLSSEQVLRLNEHKDFSNNDAKHDFGFAPTPVADILRREIKQYRDGVN